MNKPKTTTKFILSLEARVRSPDSFRAVKHFDSLDLAAQFVRERFDLTDGTLTHDIIGQRITGYLKVDRLYLTIERIEVLE